MSQRFTALRVTSDEFFQNSFFEREIAISTLQFFAFLLDLRLLLFHLPVHLFLCRGDIMEILSLVQIKTFSLFFLGCIGFFVYFCPRNEQYPNIRESS